MCNSVKFSLSTDIILLVMRITRKDVGGLCWLVKTIDPVFVL